MDRQGTEERKLRRLQKHVQRAFWSDRAYGLRGKITPAVFGGGGAFFKKTSGAGGMGFEGLAGSTTNDCTKEDLTKGEVENVNGRGQDREESIEKEVGKTAFRGGGEC